MKQYGQDFLNRQQQPQVPGRGDGYPIAPPTDPDVTDLVIRFLGNQRSGTTLAHNFAAPPAVLLYVVNYSGCRKPVFVKNRDHELFPVHVAFVASPT